MIKFKIREPITCFFPLKNCIELTRSNSRQKTGKSPKEITYTSFKK